jgi:hypothetical protein
MKGSYVWPFHSNSCSMTRLYGKGLEKVVILRNVNFRESLSQQKILLSLQAVQLSSSYFVLKLTIFKFFQADIRDLP